MTKYKKYFQKMLDENKEMFEEFRKLHDEYAKDNNKLQNAYNQLGKKIQLIVNEYENRLCSQSEKGGYGQYTPKLSEKFQSEIKKEYPYYDHIGLIVQETSSQETVEFKLTKIDLG